MSKLHKQRARQLLQESGYFTTQVTDITKHYLQNLKGVSVLDCPSSLDELRGTIKDHVTGDISTFGYRIGDKNNGHVFSVTIAKDPQKPGKVALITQDSEGRPIPPEVTRVLQESLEKKFGVGNVTHFDLGVDQQGNNVNCGVHTSLNNEEIVREIFRCYKNGESIIDKGAVHFASKLSIQKHENLTKVRDEHAKILEGMGQKADNVRIKPGSLAEEVELKAGPTPFDYKRKKPLFEDPEFQQFYEKPVEKKEQEPEEKKEEKKEEKGKEKEKQHAGDIVGGFITSLFDWLIIDVLGFEEKKKPEPTKKTGTSNVGGSQDPSKDGKKDQQPVKEISEEDKKKVEELGNKVLNPNINNNHTDQLSKSNTPDKSGGRGV